MQEPFRLDRRSLLARSAYGLGLMALGRLLADRPDTARAAAHDAGETGPRPSHFLPQVKNVIFIFMAGGPSHLDLFDPKPAMRQHHGKPVPATLLATLADPVMKASATVMASPRTFARCGRSGLELSDWLPHLAGVADELCIIRSMHTDQANHDPAQLLLNCGSPLFGLPSIGSWISYGLGSVCRDMPSYVVLLSNSGKGIDAGTALWSSGFLPSTHRGVTFRSEGDPILHLTNPKGVSRATQRARLDIIGDLNKMRQEETGDGEIASRIAAYELAFQMQSAAPQLVDLSGESQGTLAMYGLDRKETRPFGANCLLARRMIERGVRFVQLFHSTWDDHYDLNKHLKVNCDMTDQPTAALLRDLKQRGLLEETLVVWAGEFGRTPMNEVRRGNTSGKEGRDHHPFAFSLWLAGGGVKAGHVHGRTDDFGYHIAENPVHVHDLQATLLHLLGLDHERLTFHHGGRDYRLTDVRGKMVREILA